MVAIGAALLAAKETWELSMLLGWSRFGFVVVYLVMLAAATANTSIRMMAERERV